jgi:hypothetical protein
MENFLLRYPNKKDSFFGENVSGRHNVYLDPYVSLGPLGDNWYKYISGYKEAADILVDKIIDNKSHQDFLIFPTIFLYRNSVELSLKLIIRYGHQLYDIKSDYESGYKPIHNLEDLWRDCRVIIEKDWPQKEEYIEILNATENIIKDFSKLDSSSYETRYPEPKTKKDGKPKKDEEKENKEDKTFTLEGISKISPANMKELMEKIYNFLGAMCDGISVQLSEKRDIESEYNID